MLSLRFFTNLWIGHELTSFIKFQHSWLIKSETGACRSPEWHTLHCCLVSRSNVSCMARMVHHKAPAIFAGRPGNGHWVDELSTQVGRSDVYMMSKENTLHVANWIIELWRAAHFVSDQWRHLCLCSSLDGSPSAFPNGHTSAIGYTVHISLDQTVGIRFSKLE